MLGTNNPNFQISFVKTTKFRCRHPVGYFQNFSSFMIFKLNSYRFLFKLTHRQRHFASLKKKSFGIFILSIFVGMVRQYINIIMGLLYGFIGGFVIYREWFFTDLNPVASKALGILFIIYGLFRIYRAIKAIRESNA